MPFSFVALAPLFASFGLLVVGHGLLGTLLAVRMTLEGFSVQSIGFVSACYSIGFIIGALLNGRVIRRVRHIRTFTALGAIAASTTLVFVLLIEPVFWAVIRLIYGCAIAGLYMVMESWLNGNTPQNQRGQTLGAYMVLTYVGLGAGQFLLLAADPRETSLFLLVAILICLSLVPLALGRIHSPELIDIQPVDLRKLYRLQPCGLAGSFASGIIIGSFLGLGPVFAESHGFSSLDISLFMGLTISAGFLLQWPIGIVSDRYRRDRVITAIAICVAVSSLAIVLLSGLGAGPVIGLAVLWGAFVATLYPVSVALINDHLTASQFVSASAGLLFTNSIGMVIGSVAAGEAMAIVGADGLFWIATLTAVVLVVFTSLHWQVWGSLPAQEQTPYQTLPRNSPHASTLDPRGDVAVQLEFDFAAQETQQTAKEKNETEPP